jgi:putative transposase
VKYAWIKEHKALYPVVHLCRVLGVSTSGFYGWCKRKPSQGSLKRDSLAAAATRFYERSHGIYGSRKVLVDIQEETDLHCCRETLRRVMGELGLFSRVKRKYVVTTNSNHQAPIAENVLDRDFEAEAPNQKWTADITYIRTEEGWVYLAAVMDLYSRRIVGWSLSENIDANLVCEALNAAIKDRCPGGSLIHHSDRGIQYASESYQSLLDQNGIECSMSRKGNCWDNACQESFFGKLKNEWVCDKVYSNRHEAEQEIFYYIEAFYNRQRRHEKLGYVSPVDFEERGGHIKAA